VGALHIPGQLLPRRGQQLGARGRLRGRLRDRAAVGHLERRAERGIDRLAALGVAGVTALAFALAIWNGFLR
jgi:hypothetical protein